MTDAVRKTQDNDDIADLDYALHDEFTWKSLPSLIHHSYYSQKPSAQLLEQIIEVVALGTFPEFETATEVPNDDPATTRFTKFDINRLISPGELPAAASRFLTFLCSRSFLSPGTTVSDLDKQQQRNDIIEFAILGENRLRVWLAENPENRYTFWNAIMPGIASPDNSTDTMEADTVEQPEPYPDNSASTKSDPLICSRILAQNLIVVLDGNLAGLERIGASSLWKMVYSHISEESTGRKTPSQIPGLFGWEFFGKGGFQTWFRNHREEFMELIRSLASDPANPSKFVKVRQTSSRVSQAQNR